MAVAAYASLVSLTHVLDNVHYRANHSRLHVDLKQIKSIQKGVNFLLDFLEVHYGRKDQKIEVLWRQIAETGFELEEVFDLYVTGQLQVPFSEESSDMGSKAFHDDLERLAQKIKDIERELSIVEKVVEDAQLGKQTRSSVVDGVSSTPASSRVKNKLVGLDEHVGRIMNALTKDEANLKILPIVGMGGIGKTTLAKKVFDDKCMVEHFDVRLWLSISQDYCVDDILHGLINEGKVEKSNAQLDGPGEALHKKLFGRRYLIVMDDMWTTGAWDDLRRFFPNNGNKSRILMTTRLSNVATCLCSREPYVMTFLDDNSSWNLFCQTVFQEDDCPFPELEQVGRKIVRSCKGLPLEITVIGGLLANSDMRKESWEPIAANVSSFGNASESEHCSKILLLSYNNLPLYLKPCFLYMRVFREDAEINVYKLVRLWVDEGFIKARETESLEEVAKGYLEDLVDRNLIIAREKDFLRERILSCGIHDLLRDLCLTESYKEHFMCSPRVQVVVKGGSVCFLCGSCVKGKETINIPIPASLFPPGSQGNLLFCGVCAVIYSHIKGLRMVMVLYSFLQHTKLRSVNVEVYRLPKFVSPPNVHWLWNLQTLSFWHLSDSSVVYLPSEIWDMPQLRVIEAKRVVFPNPPTSHVEEKDIFVLKSLHTLTTVLNFELTDAILGGIPNMRELGIRYNEVMKGSNACLGNLVGLQKLESLYVKGAVQLQNIAFPNSLKMLILRRCSRFQWKSLSTIGSLPNLENLMLWDTTEGPEWDPTEGEFLRLKVLIIVDCDLVQWRADQSHYPKLEYLELKNLSSLEEIPCNIGDIPTLHTIHLKECCKSVMDSAYKLWEEQESLGNDSLKVLVQEGVVDYSIYEFMALPLKDDGSST
ncbi:putative late blight resistance protein homolog R1A-10 [Andrographis paniculata]|uniref:putative late blight resistance protein homolog R1A-10 n=1 Tax=Andrographis paniculata TaxID=175694 RepID=UPI0021E8989D|nr:putative late blight resistance protein homolog R1A-10 [Andrographis paniculata]